MNESNTTPIQDVVKKKSTSSHQKKEEAMKKTIQARLEALEGKTDTGGEKA